MPLITKNPEQRFGRGDHRRLDQPGKGWLGERAKQQAGDRDAELAGRDIAVEVVLHHARGAGGRLTVVGELVKLRAPGTNQGELGCHEEAVRHHQRGYRKQAQ